LNGDFGLEGTDFLHDGVRLTTALVLRRTLNKRWTCGGRRKKKSENQPRSGSASMHSGSKRGHWPSGLHLFFEGLGVKRWGGGGAQWTRLLGLRVARNFRPRAALFIAFLGGKKKRGGGLGEGHRGGRRRSLQGGPRNHRLLRLRRIGRWFIKKVGTIRGFVKKPCTKKQKEYLKEYEIGSLR